MEKSGSDVTVTAATLSGELLVIPDNFSYHNVAGNNKRDGLKKEKIWAISSQFPVSKEWRRFNE
ncbi:hypothetical protein [Ornithinibacillus halophilus]|uniref:hypothetical protein n=1 Tax=Ornithinibacillus halophilus TaxID=930117 RepID=UPI001F447CD0|nr:hypothetical protein [Ornithinibacillus halophilus]